MSYPSGHLSITGSAVHDLVDYLLAHEDDIYYGINDFDKLSHVFHVIIGRGPMQMRQFVAAEKQPQSD